MAIKRLEQILFDRRKKAKPEHDVLLLLDETRRIRSFKAGEYITFARDAKAGCVLVYQSITQIRSEEEIIEILENVGTQISSAVADRGDGPPTHRDVAQARTADVLSSSSEGSDGFTKSVQTGQEAVDYLTTAELYRRPAANTRPWCTSRTTAQANQSWST